MRGKAVEHPPQPSPKGTGMGWTTGGRGTDTEARRVKQQEEESLDTSQAVEGKP